MHKEKGNFYLLLGYREMVLLALHLLVHEEGGMPIGSLEMIFIFLLKT